MAWYKRYRVPFQSFGGTQYMVYIYEQTSGNVVTLTGAAEPFVTCIVRDKEIKLTPEEVVRQLYAERLMTEYGYPKERLVFEYPVYLGKFLATG